MRGLREVAVFFLISPHSWPVEKPEQGSPGAPNVASEFRVKFKLYDDVNLSSRETVARRLAHGARVPRVNTPSSPATKNISFKEHSSSKRAGTLKLWRRTLLRSTRSNAGSDRTTLPPHKSSSVSGLSAYYAMTISQPTRRWNGLSGSQRGRSVQMTFRSDSRCR
jgi:hypothetical protein